jgi:hypothetical protein
MNQLRGHPPHSGAKLGLLPDEGHVPPVAHSRERFSKFGRDMVGHNEHSPKFGRRAGQIARKRIGRWVTQNMHSR